MSIAFEDILNTDLIDQLYYNTKDVSEIKKKISSTLIRNENSVRNYTDHELFLREDPNSCHYFPYKMDLGTNHLICRHEFNELCLQIQDFQPFKDHKDFLLCLKDNLRDYICYKLHQLFCEYYSIVSTLQDIKYVKNFLNELLSTHDQLNSYMEKINILLDEELQSSYKFYTLYPTNSNEDKNYHLIFCFHIKSFINLPEKLFICKDNGYLNFNEEIQPVPIYRTRQSMLVNCPKCGEGYHQKKSNQSNVGSYHEKFYFSKSSY